MKYLYTLHSDITAITDLSPEEIREALKGWTAFDAEAIEAGVMVAGEALREPTTATTLTVEPGGADPVVTDGPFAESKEQLGGFYLLDCADLDEALAWGRKIPLRAGHIQVTPVADFSELGYQSPTPPPLGARA